MRAHIPLLPPHPSSHWRTALRDRFSSQTFRDKLYVLAVSALVLATIAVAAGYAIHQWPRWRAGAVGGFDSQVLPLPGEPPAAEPGAPGDAAQAPGVNRTSLIITSMFVDALIFVGLGLYLRHEMNRKP
jgi:hypothetical protein